MDTFQAVIEALAPREELIRVQREELMARHTTFAIGGAADLFIKPKTIDTLRETIECLQRFEVPYYVIGNGSNLLVSDAGVRGAVVCTSDMDEVAQHADGTMTVQAGALLSKMARVAQRSGLSGAEFAAGIPGSMGGAVFMNAGAYDGSIEHLVLKTYFLDESGNVCMITERAHRFGYRHSIFKEHPEWTIVQAVVQLKQGDQAEILNKMSELSKKRRDKQPLNYPSAGSTFKRPEGTFAGKLIEEAGLKGFSIGAAQVSEKHAGFLINRGGATCEDMKQLIAHVSEAVQKHSGYTLECEVRMLG